jgi:hypothetical protein
MDPSSKETTFRHLHKQNLHQPQPAELTKKKAIFSVKRPYNVEKVYSYLRLQAGELTANRERGATRSVTF